MAFQYKDKFVMPVKVEDARKYLSKEEISELSSLLGKIMKGRMKDGRGVNRYVVINNDEQYSADVHAILKAGEEAKERGEEYKSILPEEGIGHAAE